MCKGGSNQVQQSGSQTQTFTPTPQVSAAGNQAISMATNAANAPFSMPVAPVAGFSPLQQSAFGNAASNYGIAMPFINQGASYLGQSADPTRTQNLTSQFLNPQIDAVTRQMQNIFGQQNVQNTGNLVQSAGGVGADRVAIGQANLANQQSLAAGQTYASMYQNALQAALSQQQMTAGAGFGTAQLGPAANAAQIAGNQQIFQAGGMQQGLTQAQLNAIYQNQLAQIAYPFQTAQYLAGITAGIAPSQGGTTSGNFNSQTTYPQPSPLAQILGGVTAGAGLLGGLSGGGMFGGSSPFSAALQGIQGFGASGGQYSSPGTPYLGMGYMAPGTTYIGGNAYPMFGSGYDRGGTINPMAEGGSVIKIDPFLQQSDLRTALARSINRQRPAGFEGADPDDLSAAGDKVQVLRPQGKAFGGPADVFPGTSGQALQQAATTMGNMPGGGQPQIATVPPQPPPMAPQFRGPMGPQTGGLPMPPQQMPSMMPPQQQQGMGGQPMPVMPGMMPAMMPRPFSVGPSNFPYAGMPNTGSMPSTPFSPYDDGGAVIPGKGAGSAPIPTMPFPGQGGRSGPYGQWMMFRPPPEMRQTSGSGGGGGGSASTSGGSGGLTTGQEIGMGMQGANMAMQLLPLLAGANRGGRFADGGTTKGDKDVRALAEALLRQEYMRQHLDPVGPGQAYDDDITAGQERRQFDAGKANTIQLDFERQRMENELEHSDPDGAVYSLPKDIAAGGAVNPMAAGEGFDDGGDVTPPTFGQMLGDTASQIGQGLATYGNWMLDRPPPPAMDPSAMESGARPPATPFDDTTVTGAGDAAGWRNPDRMLDIPAYPPGLDAELQPMQRQAAVPFQDIGRGVTDQPPVVMTARGPVPFLGTGNYSVGDQPPAEPLRGIGGRPIAQEQVSDLGDELRQIYHRFFPGAPTMPGAAADVPKEQDRLPEQVPIPTSKPVQTVPVMPQQQPSQPMGPNQSQPFKVGNESPIGDDDALNRGLPNLVRSGAMTMDEYNAYRKGQMPIDPNSGMPMPRGQGASGPMGPGYQPGVPYPDALQRDWGQTMTRSPWMALVKAGAAMMSQPGNVGTVIGAGLRAGAGELEGQRTELRNEELVNQKAAQLVELAQQHLESIAERKEYHEEMARHHQETEETTKEAKQRDAEGKLRTAIPGYDALPPERRAQIRQQFGLPPEQEVLPEGVPPGSKKVTNNGVKGYRLPDGGFKPYEWS